MAFNPDYVPAGVNNRVNPYYKKINHVKIAKADSSRSEFDHTDPVDTGLWLTGGEAFGAGWIRVGGGAVYSRGSSGLSAVSNPTASIVALSSYDYSLEVLSITSGAVNLDIGGTLTGDIDTEGVHTGTLVATSNSVLALLGNINFIGVIRINWVIATP